MDRMNTRHLIVTGIGLSVLVSGCAMDTQPARRRFEVSPVGTSDAMVNAPVARPVPQLAFTGSTVDAVNRKVKAAHKALAEATPPESIPPETPDTPDTPDAAPTAAAPAAPPALAPAPEVDWLNPDRLSLSNTPTAHAPVAPARRAQRPAPPDAQVPAIEDPRAPDDASVANKGTQIVHPPPSPAAPPVAAPLPPAAPIPASAQLPASSDDPAYPSVPVGVTATAVTDPDPLGHKFAQRMRDYPNDVAAHLDYQMLRFLRDEPVPQLDTISTLPSEDRDLLTAVMDGMSNFRSGLRANRNMLLSEKVKPILDLADRVRSQAELNIPVIAICSRVQGFGVYDPMPTTLRAGIDNPVIIYCEVENFSSQQDDKGIWQTKLSQEAVLYTETGYPAWRDKSDIPLDLSRNRRHDFFVVKKVTLPRNLNIGRYNLKVSIVDEQVKRVAENSVPIQLMAQ